MYHLSPVDSIKLRRIIFFTSLLLLFTSYFAKDRYKSVDSLLPEVLQAPFQTPIENGQPIKFIKAGYNYTLTPLYDYNLNGLVLHQQKYDAWHSLSRTDKTFIKDICMSWGKTVESGSYRDSSVSVWQDSRWCWWHAYKTNLVLNQDGIANNHLIASSPSIEKKILSIGGGDQVRIIGKLVNVHAVASGKTEQYESPIIEWRTSTTRKDGGAGACEVIYVESVEILKRGNILFHLFYSIGWYGLVISILWSGIEFAVWFRRFRFNRY